MKHAQHSHKIHRASPDMFGDGTPLYEWRAEGRGLADSVAKQHLLTQMRALRDEITAKVTELEADFQ